MRSVAIFMALLLVTSGALMAQQVGTITAPGPFTLKGAKVDPKGVPSWPVSAGDEIATDAVGVTITFTDGSKITLQPHSKARVEMSGGTPVFRLLECGAFYELKSDTAVKMYAKDTAAPATGPTGKYSLSCSVKPGAAASAGGVAGFWTAKTTALVLISAGAAAGIAAGVVVAGDDGTPVSPTRQ